MSKPLTDYQIVRNHLVEYPSARERRFRVKSIRELVLKDLHLEQQMYLGPEDLDKICPRFESLMREWREVTRLEEDLRGSDWEDGKRLEQEAILNRGYEVGFNTDIKQIA